MAHFNNEAEFAGVLGHEIGHVTARHSDPVRGGFAADIDHMGIAGGVEVRQFTQV